MQVEARFLKCHHSCMIDEETSKRITSLRFLLACFVVFIHNHPQEVNFADGVMKIDEPMWSAVIRDTVTGFWGGIAVPAFFIISGYLFFAKPKPLAKTIKAKLKGIVLPYVLWTLISIFLFFVAQSFSFSKMYFVQEQNLIRSWHFLDFVKAFFGRRIPPNDHYSPLVYQFWYIRNLLMFMAFSPILLFCYKKSPFATFILITAQSALHRLGVFQDPLWISDALFYFTLGLYSVKHSSKVIAILDSIKWKDFLVAYFISLCITEYVSFNEIKANFFSWGNHLFTIALAIKLAGKMCKNEKIFAKLTFLSEYSFWIYAFHAPFVITVMEKLSLKIIPMHDALILVQFFGISILCILFLLLSGIALKKICPPLFALLNGGRK